jgi:glucose-1-phosphate adenylyltransferase
MAVDPHVLVIVLAGGEGKRLLPLTNDRAKPAVPFGGTYRLIDFALSNFANARYLKIVVLTQYKSHSLDRHISQTWRFSQLLDNYVTPVPAQMRRGPQWFQGSADAIYQNLNLIYDENPDVVCVFGADHIYRMDPRQMVAQHMETDAGVTVAAIPVPRHEAVDFGVIESDESGKIIHFHEKSPNPPTMPGDDSRCLASMGNYVFDTQTLIDVVTPHEHRYTDLGSHVIPALTDAGVAQVYDFSTNEVPGQDERERGYWRDVGSIDSYFSANMDLIARCRSSICTTTNGRCTRTAGHYLLPRCRVGWEANPPSWMEVCSAKAQSSQAPMWNGRSSGQGLLSITMPMSPNRSFSPECISALGRGFIGASSTKM